MAALSSGGHFGDLVHTVTLDSSDSNTVSRGKTTHWGVDELACNTSRSDLRSRGPPSLHVFPDGLLTPTAAAARARCLSIHRGEKWKTLSRRRRSKTQSELLNKQDPPQPYTDNAHQGRRRTVSLSAPARCSSCHASDSSCERDGDPAPRNLVPYYPADRTCYRSVGQEKLGAKRSIDARSSLCGCLARHSGARRTSALSRMRLGCSLRCACRYAG